MILAAASRRIDRMAQRAAAACVLSVNVDT